MKKFFFFLSIFFIIHGFSTNTTFFFKDGVVNYIEFTGKTFEIPNNQEVFWVSGADNWEIKEFNNSFTFKIISLDDYKNYFLEKVNDNIFSIKNNNKIIFFNSQLQRWCETNKSNLKYLISNKSIVFKKEVHTLIGLLSKGSWNFIYEMYNDGTFNQNIELLGKIIGISNVYLINKQINNFPKRTPILLTKNLDDEYSPNINQEIYTLKIGTIQSNNDKNYIKLNSYDILSFSDKYEINLNNTKEGINFANIIRTIENTENNRLGEDFPAGRLLIHQTFGNKSFAIENILMQSVSKGETMLINLGKSWNIKYNILKIKNSYLSTSKTRFITYEINLNNYSDKKKNIVINMKQPGLELIKYNTTLNVINKSITGNINLCFTILPKTNLKMTIQLKIQY